jgi:phage FluMu protein Com
MTLRGAPTAATVSARIRNLRCEKCGRPFVSSDVDSDGSATIRLTCARCHDRPVEIETRTTEIPATAGSGPDVPGKL